MMTLRKKISKIVEIGRSTDDIYDQGSQIGSHSPTNRSCVTPKIIEKYSTLDQNEFLILSSILERAHELRSHNQLKYISHFVKKNQFLKSLIDILGLQFAKGIMRSAMLEEYKQNQFLAHAHSPITSVFIILQGRVAVVKNNSGEDILVEMKLKEIYEALSVISTREIKKFTKLNRKMSTWADQIPRYRQLYNGEPNQQYLEIFDKNTCFGDKQRCLDRQYSHTAMALERTIVLSIDIKNLFYWLNYTFEQKIAKSFNLLKNHPCFDFLQDEVLEELIHGMTIKKMRKMDYVYHQGEQSTCIYFLDEGELKIQKETQLFIENPNELYIDRRKLLNDSQKNQSNYLPYANLRDLYNYRPVNKIIDLGIINPFSLFGEEQIIQNKTREASIVCSSLEVVFYQIDLKKIYQVLAQKIPQFLLAVKNYIKNKVMYRQDQFATTVNLQNKNNLKYFYFEGEKSLPTPRKYIIKKINEKMSSKHHTINLQSLEANPQGEYENGEACIEKRLKKKEEDHQSIPPYYNTFNFHRMLKTRLGQADRSLLHQEDDEQEYQGSKKGNKFLMNDEVKRERKIIGNSHTWHLVKQKVKEQYKISKRIGSLKHTINFRSPLIEQKYFRDIEGEIKRIEREKKNRKFQTSKSRKKALSQFSIKGILD